MDTAPEYGDHLEGLPVEKVLLEIDMMASQLRIHQSRYIEKPNPTRQKEMDESDKKLVTLFGNILWQLDTDDTISTTEKITVLTTLIHDIDTEQGKLLADYSKLVELDDAENAEYSKAELYETLERSYSDEDEDFFDTVLEVLKGTIELDWRVISDYHSRTLRGRAEPVRRATLKATGEILKIGAGVALGVVAVDRLFGK